jgi:hypothetical protein
VLALAILASLACGAARAQGDVLFPGSTVQGDILRGQGVTYKGAALLYLNAAKARSIDADTLMRFNQYVYDSLQEYNRQRALRLAGKAANRNANLAVILRRLRESPTESDVTGGDALNIVLGELCNPSITPSSWRAARVDLPADTIRRVPFQYASAGGVISMRRLKASAPWPVSLRYKGLETHRETYLEAIDTLLTQCQQKKLTPEAVEAVGKAVRDLRAKAAATIPAANRDYQLEARRYLDELEQSARMLTKTSFIEDLLGEIGAYRGTTVGELLEFMRRYNLYFSPADDPDERQLYITLYPAFRGQREALGLREIPDTASPLAERERPLPLFRGRTLNGWAWFSRDGIPVEMAFRFDHAGMLVCYGSPGGIQTDAFYRDFVLRLEYRLESGQVSRFGAGILINQCAPDRGMFGTIECDIGDGTTGRLWLSPGATVNGMTPGGDKPLSIPRLSGEERPVGQWNEYEIRCAGREITLSLNGQVVNRGTCHEPIWGRIGVISQESVISYRNIRLSAIVK